MKGWEWPNNGNGFMSQVIHLTRPGYVGGGVGLENDIPGLMSYIHQTENLVNIGEL